MKTLLIGLIGLCITANAWATGPFSIAESRDISITTTRSSYDFGWEIQAGVDGGDILGSVIDNNGAYTQESYLESGTDGLTFYFHGLGEEIAVVAGDSVTFTYLTVVGGGEVTEKIFFGAITQNTKLYIGDDNCSYSDSARSSKVGMTPSPSVTPTAHVPTPTPSTTPSTTPSPTPSITPTPGSADIWYQVGDSIYPAISGSDLDLTGDMSVQSVVVAGVILGDTISTTGRITASEATTTDVTGIAGYFSETVSGTHGLAAPTYAIGSYGKCNASMYAGTDVYMAGAVGYYGVTGTNASVYPVAATLGWVGGETTTADGAFVAVLGGDSGITTAGAAYAVRSTNSTPGTHFDYGVDLYSGVILAYNAVVYDVADFRLGKGETIGNLTDGIIDMVGDLQVRGAFNYAGTSASTGLNTYVLDATPDMVVTAPTLGQYISWTSDTAGDGASTLSIDGVDDTLQDRAGNATTAGDVIVGPMQAQFDGTNWRLIGI